MPYSCMHVLHTHRPLDVSKSRSEREVLMRLAFIRDCECACLVKSRQHLVQLFRQTVAARKVDQAQMQILGSILTDGGVTRNSAERSIPCLACAGVQPRGCASFLQSCQVCRRRCPLSSAFVRCSRASP